MQIIGIWQEARSIGDIKVLTMGVKNIYYRFVIFLIFVISRVNVNAKTVDIIEDNWTQVLEGEWMIKL